MAKWVNCSLTNEPLAPPLAVDLLGNLFNMEPLAAAVADKRLPENFRYIRDLKKDIFAVKMEISSGGIYRCPVMGVEMNDDYKFYALTTCGHVVSEMGLLRSFHCRVCGKPFKKFDKIVINGNPFVEFDKIVMPLVEFDKIVINGTRAKLAILRLKIRLSIFRNLK